MKMLDIAVSDLKRSVDRLDLAWALASDDIKQRYRRTALGPIWLVLGIGLWVGMTGFLGSSLFHADLKGYFTNVAIGMVLWIFLSNMLNEGTTLIQHNGNLILNTDVPMGVYIVRSYLKNLILFLHYLVIPISVLLILGVTIKTSIVWVLPGFLLYSLAAVSTVTILMFLCARYRDLQQAVVAIVQIVPLITPILWSRDFLPANKRWIADINPLYHFISLIRLPLAGRDVDPNSIWISLVTTAVLIVAAFASFVAFNKKAAFWI